MQTVLDAIHGEGAIAGMHSCATTTDVATWPRGGGGRHRRARPGRRAAPRCARVWSCGAILAAGLVPTVAGARLPTVDVLVARWERLLVDAGDPADLAERDPGDGHLRAGRRQRGRCFASFRLAGDAGHRIRTRHASTTAGVEIGPDPDRQRTKTSKDYLPDLAEPDLPAVHRTRLHRTRLHRSRGRRLTSLRPQGLPPPAGLCHQPAPPAPDREGSGWRRPRGTARNFLGGHDAPHPSHPRPSAASTWASPRSGCTASSSPRPCWSRPAGPASAMSPTAATASWPTASRSGPSSSPSSARGWPTWRRGTTGSWTTRSGSSGSGRVAWRCSAG